MTPSASTMKVTAKALATIPAWAADRIANQANEVRNLGAALAKAQAALAKEEATSRALERELQRARRRIAELETGP